MVFDGAAHVPIATLPGMAERKVTISSAEEDALVRRLEDPLGMRAVAAQDALDLGEAAALHASDRAAVGTHGDEGAGSVVDGEFEASTRRAWDDPA
jgi:hypothetical protein